MLKKVNFFSLLKKGGSQMGGVEKKNDKILIERDYDILLLGKQFTEKVVPRIYFVAHTSHFPPL